MLDIETTGLDQKNDEILQIAIVVMEKKTIKYSDYGERPVSNLWMPGDHLSIYQHTDKTPDNDFSKKYQSELYSICNEAPAKDPKSIREDIKQFLNWHIKEPKDIVFAGLSVGNFDLPFLANRGWLLPEDYSHRVYDVNSVISFYKDLKAINNSGHKEVITAAKSLGYAQGRLRDLVPKDIAERKNHEGLKDCYDEIAILNGLLTLLE